MELDNDVSNIEDSEDEQIIDGQWKMAYLPGENYKRVHKLYVDDLISEKRFLKWYRDPRNYRPELIRKSNNKTKDKA